MRLKDDEQAPFRRFTRGTQSRRDLAGVMGVVRDEQRAVIFADFFETALDPLEIFKPALDHGNRKSVPYPHRRSSQSVQNIVLSVDIQPDSVEYLSAYAQTERVSSARSHDLFRRYVALRRQAERNVCTAMRGDPVIRAHDTGARVFSERKIGVEKIFLRFVILHMIDIRIEHYGEIRTEF